MKKLFITLLVLLVTFSLKAQNEFDVLRYSTLDYYGGARFNAMGGSFGALGADMGGLSINPGGLGVYKSSDFSFSTGFHYNSTESKTDVANIVDDKFNVNFSHVGFVASFPSVSNGWKFVNVGIGYNRTANYYSRIAIKSNTNVSQLNTYTNELNADGGILQDDIEFAYPFGANLAYQNYLVNPLVTDSMQYDHVFKDSKNLTQATTYNTRGGAGETYFSVGGNYDDKLYFGVLMGVPNIRYNYHRTYKETSEKGDTLTEFNSFTINDNVRTKGTGINLKVGVILKVMPWFRVGAAIHTPTKYFLSDTYTTSISSEMKDRTTYSETSPSGVFDYTITTPYRIETSASFIYKKYGVINVDYEVVDYSASNIREARNFGTTTADFSVENKNIKSNFVVAQNLRIGTEWRIDPFRIRAGIRYMGNSLSDEFKADNSAFIYSGGIGIKKEGYYVDASYSLKSYKSEAVIVAENQEFSTVTNHDHYITFTLGFRF